MIGKIYKHGWSIYGVNIFLGKNHRGLIIIIIMGEYEVYLSFKKETE